jgi:hypothetical protein
MTCSYLAKLVPKLNVIQPGFFESLEFSWVNKQQIIRLNMKKNLPASHLKKLYISAKPGLFVIKNKFRWFESLGQSMAFKKSRLFTLFKIVCSASEY